MMEDNEDDARIEMAYIETRVAELKEELQRNETALGFRVTEENIGDVAAGVVDVLRRSGNHVLADKYTKLFERMQEARQHIDRWLASGDLPDKSAMEAMEDFTDEFDQVTADVSAYLVELDEKGGA
jgi:hypothetical protein